MIKIMKCFNKMKMKNIIINKDDDDKTCSSRC